MDKRVVLFVDDAVGDWAPKLGALCPSFNIVPVQSPRQALEQFRFSEVQPDLIVLDVNFHGVEDEVRKDFPNQDARVLGVHLLEILRRMDPDIPIVILTAFGNLNTAFGAGHHQANAFYTKEESFQDGSVIETRLKALLNESRYTYDREQQQLAEKVADSYRDLEAGSPGTIAYWYFEEQKLIETVQLIDKPDVHVLDIGIGDGRYPEVLFREFPDKVRITGIDFSGKMLNRCRARFSGELSSGRLRLERCIAEQLPFDEDSFDVVIAGFGFLSYSTSPRVLASIHRVARPDAHVLLGSYNYDALFYDIWKNELLSAENVPISGRIDRDRGTLHLGQHTIGVRPATVHETKRLLLQHNFDLDSLWTFPTLYASLGADLSKRLITQPIEPSKYHGYNDFSPRLYEQDVAHSASLDAQGDHKGYYTLARCHPARNP
jgi:ubiquinone/menaquinone biosynthesis C-methylase UbiE/ActR/RegA family two-component response regulator